MDDVIEQVLSEITACVRQVQAKSLVQAGELIESASRIFVAGAGRSGLCMRALGMRLMHKDLLPLNGDQFQAQIADAVEDAV
jgi:6-phospho-3-hexuloisomerase